MAACMMTNDNYNKHSIYNKNYKGYYATSDPWSANNYKDKNIIFDYGTTATTTSIDWYICDSTTAATDTWATWDNCYYKWDSGWSTPITKPKSPETRLREIITSRQAPAVHNRERWRLHRSTQVCPNEREARARQTLRRVIGDDKFKSFLRNGFVTVRNPKSGLSYQIFPGHGITCVFENGKMTERLCIILQGDFPPTDSIIMRYLMILNNEEQFREIAIAHTVTQRKKKIIAPDNRNLMEIFEELKAA